jgi:hypothetical protein
VDQLEVLSLLQAQEGPQSVSALNRRIYSHPDLIQARLYDLESQGLVRSGRDGTELLFWYEPATPELDRLAHAAVRAYAERRARVIEIIYQSPDLRLHRLADAFSLRTRKDPSDA